MLSVGGSVGPELMGFTIQAPAGTGCSTGKTSAFNNGIKPTITFAEPQDGPKIVFCNRENGFKPSELLT